MAQNRSSRGTKAFLLATTASLLLAGTALAQTAPRQTPRSFDIPAQDAAAALQTYARQTGRQILFRYDLVTGRRTPAIRGNFTDEEVLARLADAAGLAVTSNDGRTVTLQPRPQSAGQGETPVLEDIIVTGTNIRGANPTAPVHVVTREDIDRSGYGSVGDVIQSLPENFGGGQNPGNMAAGGVNQNITNASTVNLRGLGADATLVLLNGRRLAADGYGQAADISGIPLAALSRIEVVTDGSSAIYGSDAVAGVANFILRKNYQGIDLSARFGRATQGGGFEQTYTALFGTAGDDGYGLLNVEYSKQDAISASDRDFTATAPTNVNLTRPQERTSAFLSAGRDLTDRVSVGLDALWSERHVEYTYQLRRTGTPQSITTDTTGYFVSGFSDIELPHEWNLRLNATTAFSRSDQVSTAPTFVSHVRYRNETQSAEAILGGAVLDLPSGELKVALGGGLREELYRGDSRTGTFRVSGSHDVKYLFGEALIPLVAPSTKRAGLQALDLSVSGRYEDYSDFGSTSTPKVGLRYVPVFGLTVRSTWGESFKAPTFTQRSQGLGVLIAPASILGRAGGGNVLYATGGNGDLRPERATSWTLGVDYSPSWARSMTLGATYFDIDYNDRVVTPISPASAALSNPAFAPFATYNPSPGEQAALLAQAATVVNQSGAAYNPSTVVAIVRNTSTNASSQKVQGIDLSYLQNFSIGAGELRAFANATFIEVRQQTLPTMVAARMSGTIFQIPEVRARAGLSWEYRDFVATGALNYQEGSEDTGVLPSRHIASQTTTDVNIVYSVPAKSGGLAGVSFALSVTNVFDLDPPFAASPAVLHDGIYFDSTNSSVVGRYISVTLRKQF